MRLPGWPIRLASWAQRRLGSPFEWGESDCALVVIEAFDAITGSRHIGEYRGRYHSARQAARFQKRHHIDLAAWLERVGAFRWQGVALFGDLILHPHPELPFMVGHVVVGPDRVLSAHPEAGVCLGEQSAALAQPGSCIWRIA